MRAGKPLRPAAPAVALLLSLALAPAARAEVIVSNLAGSQSLGIPIAGSFGAAGRFSTGPEPVRVDALTVRILEQSNATGSGITATLRPDAGGLPSHVSLALAAFAVPAPPLFDVYQNVTVAHSGPPLFLEPDTVYWIALRANGNGRIWRGSNSEPEVGDMGTLGWVQIIGPGANENFTLQSNHRPMFALAGSPTPSLALSRDVTVEVAGTTVRDEEVADPLGVLPIPGLPPQADVNGYHAIPGGDTLYTLDTGVDLGGGLAAGPADVVRTDGVSHWIEFDALAAGVPPGAAVDALSVHPSGDLILSFDVGVDLAGLAVDDEDLVRWDGAAFALFVDGSAAGVPPELDLDGVHYQPADDTLLVSFDGGGRISSGGRDVDFHDEDVLVFDPLSGDWNLALPSGAASAALSAADVNALPEPGGWLGLGSGIALLAALSGTRRRRELP